MAPPVRIKMTPPKLAPLTGRASPRGSLSPRGIGAGIDQPNKVMPSRAEMTGQPHGMPVQSFCKGGKVISTKAM